jgi:microcystin-dependent protein
MEPFLGQISVFGFDFAPANWAPCAGQIVPISQNTSLFSLLGTRFGGNGTTTFALPNMGGSVAVGQGQLIGGSNYDLGEIGGTSTVTLKSVESPTHSHALMASAAAADQNSPEGSVLARPTKTGNPQSIVGAIYNTNTPNQLINAPISGVGKGLPHNNIQPYLALTYCICIRGIFPPRG